MSMKLWEPKEVSKSRLKTLPKSWIVVTGPQVYGEAICDQALNQMLFQSIYVHAASSHMIKSNKSMLARFSVAWSPSFVSDLPPRGGFWKYSKWASHMIHSMPYKNPRRFYINIAFTYSVGPSSVVWSELGPTPPFPPMRVPQVQWSQPLVSYVKWPLRCPILIYRHLTKYSMFTNIVINYNNYYFIVVAIRINYKIYKI